MDEGFDNFREFGGRRRVMQTDDLPPSHFGKEEAREVREHGKTRDGRRESDSE